MNLRRFCAVLIMMFAVCSGVHVATFNTVISKPLAVNTASPIRFTVYFSSPIDSATQQHQSMLSMFDIVLIIVGSLI